MTSDHADDNNDKSFRPGNEMLAVTLESIRDGVILTDVSGRVTFLNPVAERLTGWSMNDARDQPFEQVFNAIEEQSEAQVENPLAKALKDGDSLGLTGPIVLIARDGRRTPIESGGAPVRIAHGKPAGIVVVFRDVTERRRAEHDHAWLAALVESSEDAIVSKTLDGIVTSWNPAAVRLFGYEPAQIVGKSIMTIIPPELQAEEAEILSRLRRGQRIEHYETVRVAKDGRRIDVSLTVSPIRGADGSISGASKISRDITERKRSERALQEADRQKDEFLATLAHELRNPLAPICAAAELLKNAKTLAPELRAATTILERQARHMTHLVDDLLEMSRLMSGRLLLRPEPIDVSDLLNAVITASRQAIETARHQISLTVPSAPVHVNGDRLRLSQALANILHTAVTHTPPGGKIEVDLRAADAEAIVSFRDNGRGIAPEMLNRVFEPFAPLHRSFEHPDGGIGLALAKRLLDLHHGRIEAASAGRGQGTEFVIHLPAITTGAGLRATVPQKQSRFEGSRRVLIADDNHDAGISLSMLLQSMGHDTRVVHDGIEALQEAELFHPEVVLLDLGMPRLDGYETARRIAARDWAADTQIVAVTGWGQEADRQRAKEAGFHRHLVKPVDVGALQEVMADQPAPRPPGSP
jgi:PAS domain S-box-containing protein